MIMDTRRPGFTLVEFLVVAVLGTLVIGGLYQTLIAQERSYRVSSGMMQNQDAVRTAIGILESELREVGALGGVSRGGSDILVAAPDSVVFRAQRNLAVVCQAHPSDKMVYAAVIGDGMRAADTVMIHASQLDRWEIAAVDNVTSGSSECAAFPELSAAANMVQRMKFVSHGLGGVVPGSPIRSMQTLTYGLYDFGPAGWGLGRREPLGAPQRVVTGLAGPGEGLRFDYFRQDGTVASDTSQIASIRVTVRTGPDGTGAAPAEVVTNLKLRN